MGKRSGSRHELGKKRNMKWVCLIQLSRTHFSLKCMSLILNLCLICLTNLTNFFRADSGDADETESVGALVERKTKLLKIRSAERIDGSRPVVGIFLKSGGKSAKPAKDRGQGTIGSLQEGHERQASRSSGTGEIDVSHVGTIRPSSFFLREVRIRHCGRELRTVHR